MKQVRQITTTIVSAYIHPSWPAQTATSQRQLCHRPQAHVNPSLHLSAMSSFAQGDIVIIGAGLVGSLLGYILQKKGYSVSIFERYGDIRQIPSLGRSINLVITSRGLRACDSIGGGLKEEIISLAVAVTGRVLHQQDGSVQFQQYGKDDTECNYSISR